jgi:hypothetical protein
MNKGDTIIPAYPIPGKHKAAFTEYFIQIKVAEVRLTGACKCGGVRGLFCPVKQNFVECLMRIHAILFNQQYGFNMEKTLQFYKRVSRECVRCRYFRAILDGS